MSSQADNKRWWALAVIALAQFITIMDTSIIGVALPDIQRTLGFSQDGLSWVFNAYVIAFGGLLLLGGRLSDLFGARSVFVTGWTILIGGSLLAGLAESTSVEIAGRAVQGAGAALIAPAALALLMTLFGREPKELTKALALYGAAAPAGGTAGVFLGGVLTDGLDWRWTLLINIPVAMTVLAATPALLPAGARRRERLDIVGSVLVTAALALAVFGIVDAGSAGWGSTQTIGVLTGALGLLSAFVASQALTRRPLVPLGIFRTGNFSAANASLLLLGAAWVPMWFVLNLYLQQVLGYGPFEAGSALLPMTALIMLLMVGAATRVIGRFGLKAPIVAGMLTLSAGMALFGLVGSDGGYVENVLWASLVAAAGMSLAYIPALNAGLSALAPEQGGLASGVLGVSYQIGAALGLAVMTSIATSFGADELGNAERLTDGFQAAFIATAGVALLGAAVALGFLRGGRPQVPESPEETVDSPVDREPIAA
ncbi:MAG: MFS transporter [Actinomycetota bacterium]|nr:MFS transporter [Actinomycetota bacterium]